MWNQTITNSGVDAKAILEEREKKKEEVRQ